MGWLGEGDAPYQATPDEMAHALRTPAKGSAPGPSGFSTRLWQRTLVENEQLPTKFTKFINGTLPENLRELWAACRSLALEKPDGGPPPHLHGRRGTPRDGARRALRPPGRHPAPLPRQGLRAERLRERCARPDAAQRAAPRPVAPAHGHHQRVQHPAALRLPEGGEETLPGAACRCARSSTRTSPTWSSTAASSACSSRAPGQLQQGDTLGSLLFCLGIHPILEEAHARWPEVLIRAICDDVHVAGPDATVAEARSCSSAPAWRPSASP